MSEQNKNIRNQERDENQKNKMKQQQQGNKGQAQNPNKAGQLFSEYDANRQDKAEREREDTIPPNRSR
jgi:hypothetical protein